MALESAPPFQAPGQTFQNETSGFIFIAQHPDRPTSILHCLHPLYQPEAEGTDSGLPAQAGG